MSMTRVMMGAAVVLLGTRWVSAETQCDRDCDVAAVKQYEDCVTNLEPDATANDKDACRVEARITRNQCRDACPDDNPNGDSKCHDECEQGASVIFDACVVALGKNPTNDEIDVCEGEARVVRDTCSAECPVSCEEQCGIDGKAVYDDCVAFFGGDATDAENDMCKAKARAARSACRASCPLPCHEQCGKDADAIYDACIASFGGNPTPDEGDFCDDDSRAYRGACRAECPPEEGNPDECRDQCEAEATVAFEECEATLGDNPTNDEIDVCEDASRVSRDTCNANCNPGMRSGSMEFKRSKRLSQWYQR